MRGTQLGTYTLGEKLGEGGMGVVYSATDSRLKRKAVIKMLHKHLADNQEIAKRFQNEAIAAAGIGHPGIVEIYDTGYADDGSLYIAMELLRGQSLQDRLEEAETLPPDRAIAIIRQCASALAAAHEGGIVHRDLKPDNIFLETDSAVQWGERAKLLDFGIAKLMGASASSILTGMGATMGTAYYMSPEQCRDAGGVDHRTDLYALGCILFQILTGRLPFVGASNNELIIAHVVEPPPQLRSVDPSFSLELENVIGILLAKTASDRFASADALIAALDNIQELSATPAKVANSSTTPPANRESALLPSTRVSNWTPNQSDSGAALASTPITTLGATTGESNDQHSGQNNPNTKRSSSLVLLSLAGGLLSLAGVAYFVVTKRSAKPETPTKPSHVISASSNTITPVTPDSGISDNESLRTQLTLANEAEASADWKAMSVAAQAAIVINADNPEALEFSNKAQLELKNQVHFEDFQRAIIEKSMSDVATTFSAIDTNSIYKAKGKSDHDRLKSEYLLSMKRRGEKLAAHGKCKGLSRLAHESPSEWSDIEQSVNAIPCHSTPRRSVGTSDVLTAAKGTPFGYESILPPLLPKKLSKAQVSKGIQKIRNSARRCWTVSHSGNAKAVAKIHIQANGQVGEVTINGGGGGRLHKCLKSAVRKASFPMSAKGTVVKYPFVFK